MVMWRSRGPSSSTKIILCQLPSTNWPSSTGTVTLGPIIELARWAGTCAGLCGWRYFSLGIISQTASKRSRSVPGSKSAVVTAQVVCAKKTKTAAASLPTCPCTSSVISTTSRFLMVFIVRSIVLFYQLKRRRGHTDPRRLCCTPRFLADAGLLVRASAVGLPPVADDPMSPLTLRVAGPCLNQLTASVLVGRTGVRLADDARTGQAIAERLPLGQVHVQPEDGLSLRPDVQVAKRVVPGGAMAREDHCATLAWQRGFLPMRQTADQLCFTCSLDDVRPNQC